MVIGIVLIIVVIYLILTAVVANCRTESYYVRDDLTNIRESTRDLEPKDVWVGLIWPLLFIWYALKVVGTVLHEVVAAVLLMFCIRYNKTNLYKRINEVLDF